MKLFFSLFAAFSLWECCGGHPAWAGLITLLGTGTVIGGAAPLTPPAITPQPSLAFSPSNSYGYINQGMKPNGGTVGSMELPSTPTNSFALYHEFTLGGGYLFGQNSTTAHTLAIINGTNQGPPTLTLQASVSVPWWLPTVGAQPYGSSAPASFSPHGTGYNGGIYTWTAADGCPTANGAGAREPKGTVLPGGPAPTLYVIGPGFLCGENASGQAPQVSFAAIPGIGANQATWGASRLSETSGCGN